jgi:hypothetical protein
MAREAASQSKPLVATHMLALALGALAIGALAIGRLAVGRLVIKEARFGALEVDELRVRRSRVAEGEGRVAGGVDRLRPVGSGSAPGAERRP